MQDIFRVASNPLPVSIPGILLAAGASRRMGRPKALLRCGGRTFVELVVDALEQGGMHPVVVVTRDDLVAAIGSILGGRQQVVVNPDPERGMLSSILAGLDHLEALGASACALGFGLALVDQPCLRPATVRRLLDFFGAHPDRIVIPSFKGRGGHPVIFPPTCIRELRVAPPDEGARWVMRRDRARVKRVAFADGADFADVDTPEDLLRVIPTGAGPVQEGNAAGES